MRRSNQGNRQQGDASILFVFLLLTVFLLGVIVIAVLSITNLRSVRDIVASTSAFLGADTGVERGLTVYNWDTDGEQFPNDEQTCIPVGAAADQQVDGRPIEEVRYDIRVFGRAVNRGDRSCPSGEEVANGTAALCITARGKARNGAIQRLVTNNFVNMPAVTLDPCR